MRWLRAMSAPPGRSQPNLGRNERVAPAMQLGTVSAMTVSINRFRALVEELRLADPATMQAVLEEPKSLLLPVRTPDACS
jgi:hypothetical protein